MTLNFHNKEATLSLSWQYIVGSIAVNFWIIFFEFLVFYPEGDCLEKVVAKVTEGLEGLENQPANVEKYSNLDKSPATFGVVKKLRDNDTELHENNPVSVKSLQWGCE